MKTFVMGDIHGSHKALIQCLDRCDFNYQNDRLIQLGDVADGHDEVFECVEELLQIKSLISIKGNHDDWFNEFIETDFHPYYWTYGGKGTLVSYLKNSGKNGRYFASSSGFKSALTNFDIPKEHQDFFKKQQLYYLDEYQRLFLHAGFDRHNPFLEQKQAEYFWNRSLWIEAMEYKTDGKGLKDFGLDAAFNEIYIGHTSTLRWCSDKPLTAYNITNMDTGAGSTGRLTIMDIDNKMFWQSDLLSELYPKLQNQEAIMSNH